MDIQTLWPAQIFVSVDRKLPRNPLRHIQTHVNKLCYLLQNNNPNEIEDKNISENNREKLSGQGFFLDIIKNPSSKHPLQAPRKHGIYVGNAPFPRHLPRTNYD